MKETQILCCKMGVEQTRGGGVKFHLCDDGLRRFNSEIASQSLINVVAKKALIQRNIGMEIGT